MYEYMLMIIYYKYIFIYTILYSTTNTHDLPPHRSAPPAPVPLSPSPLACRPHGPD